MMRSSLFRMSLLLIGAFAFASRSAARGRLVSPSMVRMSQMQQPTMRTKKSVACYGRRDEEKDEQWRVQQEILARRRNKDKQRAYFESIDKKRSDLKKNFDAKRIKYRKGEDPLGQWKEINKGKTYKDEYSDEPGYSLPIPIASFGLPKFDNGERFDLRLPYVDQGYVAEDSDDAWGRFLGIFGGKKDGEKKASSTAAAKSSGKKTTVLSYCV